MNEIYVEIYSTQFDSGTPVCMEDVTDSQEVLDMIESIPIEPYMMCDLYIDICNVKDPFFQTTFSITGCRNLSKMKKFVVDTWPLVLNTEE